MQSRIPKQWKLITLYIIFVYVIYVGIIHYVKGHPIIDEHGVGAQTVQDAGQHPETEVKPKG